ncbi:RNA polymerase sigma factor sigX, partial [Dysosmobacter welbionis]
HRRVCHGCPGNGQQLPLALGQIGAVAGEHGVVPLGQAADEVVGIGQGGGRLHLFIRGIQIAVADVLPDGAGEEVGVLQHDAQAAPQVRLADVVDGDAVVTDLAVGNVVEPVDQVGDGGLAGAGGTHEGQLLARLGKEADVVEDGLALLIGEVHMVE